MTADPDIPCAYDRDRAEALRSLSRGADAVDTGRPWLRRLVLPGLLVALMATAAVGAMLYRPASPDQPGVETAEAGRDGEKTGRAAAAAVKPVAREIASSGFVVAPRTAVVFAKYEGRVSRIETAPGETVAAGQVLAKLEDAGADFALEQARAAKRQAELVTTARLIDLAQARALVARKERLAASEAGSRQALDDARTAMERAANALEQARHACDSADLLIRIAEEHVAELTIRAPIAGVVTRMDAHLGEMVLSRADNVRESQSLFAITDMDSLAIDADVAEAAVAPLKPGLRGEATLDAFPDRPFPIAVLRLAPVATAEKGAVTLRLSLDHPPAGIRPKMAARIRIALEPAGDAIP